MRRLYILAIALLALVSCQEKELANQPKPVAKPKSELEQKAGWILGKWGKLSEKADLVHEWIKIDDSTFRCDGSLDIKKLPDTLPVMKTVSFLQLRNDTIWQIDDEGDKKWRSIVVGATKNSISFKSLDNGDLKTLMFHGDSITSDNTYEHNVKQQFVFYKLK